MAVGGSRLPMVEPGKNPRPWLAADRRGQGERLQEIGRDGMNLQRPGSRPRALGERSRSAPPATSTGT